MPPKAVKRKAKVAAGEDDDLWGFAGDQPRKRARKSASHIDENSEDSGPKIDRQFQSWAAWQKKFNDKEKDDKRRFADTFKHNIEDNREAIQKLIQESDKSLKDADNKQYTELYEGACAEFDPAAGSNSDSTTKTRQDCTLFKAGLEIVRKCRDLVAIHEQANDKASVQGDTRANEKRALWEADMDQVQKAMVYGAQYGKKVIQCNIDMSSNEDIRSQLLSPPKDVLSGPGLMALDMHQSSIENLLKNRPTWGEEALKYVDKFVSIATVCELQAKDT